MRVQRARMLRDRALVAACIGEQVVACASRWPTRERDAPRWLRLNISRGSKAVPSRLQHSAASP
jgi:hypothetical protein